MEKITSIFFGKKETPSPTKAETPPSTKAETQTKLKRLDDNKLYYLYGKEINKIYDLAFKYAAQSDLLVETQLKNYKQIVENEKPYMENEQLYNEYETFMMTAIKDMIEQDLKIGKMRPGEEVFSTGQDLWFKNLKQE